MMSLVYGINKIPLQKKKNKKRPGNEISHSSFLIYHYILFSFAPPLPEENMMLRTYIPLESPHTQELTV